MGKQKLVFATLMFAMLGVTCLANWGYDSIELTPLAQGELDNLFGGQTGMTCWENPPDSQKTKCTEDTTYSQRCDEQKCSKKIINVGGTNFPVPYCPSGRKGKGAYNATSYWTKCDETEKGKSTCTTLSTYCNTYFDCATGDYTSCDPVTGNEFPPEYICRAGMPHNLGDMIIKRQAGGTDCKKMPMLTPPPTPPPTTPPPGT